MTHPEVCYSHDSMNNCIMIYWGESGYYETDYPKGKYDDEIINEMNERLDITPQMRNAMECCSMVSQYKDIDWEKHYEMVMGTLNKGNN